MAKSLHNTLSFSSGEWSPKLESRVDQPKYSSAQRQCQNLIPYKTGGLTRRPGTIWKANCKYQNTDVYQYATRLVPFQFSPTTSFVLELGDKYIRFYSNQQQVTLSTAPAWVSMTPYVVGNFVLSASVIYYCIANVTSATAPASDPTHWVVQNIYEVPSPYSGKGFNGPSIFTLDVWTVVPCQINDVIYFVHPSYPPYSLTRLADTNWVMKQVNFLTPALLDQNATDTVITPNALRGTGITLNATAPGWVTATFYNVANSVLVAGVIYNCIFPNVSSASFANDLAAGYWEVSTIFRAGHIGSTWQLAVLRSSAFIEYTGVAATGFVAGTSSQIQCLGQYEVHTYGVWSGDIAIQRSLDNGQTWENVMTVTGRSDRNVDRIGKAAQLGIYRINVSNVAVPVNPGATNPRVVFECTDAFLYGAVKITAVSSAYVCTADVVSELSDSNGLSPQWIGGTSYVVGNKVNYAFVNYTCIVNVSGTTPPSQDSTSWTPTTPGGTEYWSEAAWSNYRGYPQAVTAFQQRMIYGGTAYEPQRIWGTVTNDIENFALGDQSLATDSIVFDLAAVGRGPIQWLIGQVDLIVGFSAAEWIVNAGQGSFGGSNQPITATQINAGEHSSWGSATGIPPIIAGNAILYTQRSSQTIQQMLFSVYTNKYMSSDLTILSEHMFGGGIVQLAYQPLFRNQGIIWVTTQSGSLCGMTYQLEQEVFGWHRHITGFYPNPTSNDAFESVVCIDGKNSQDDELWVVVSRGSTRSVELINPANWEIAGSPVLGIQTADPTKSIYVDSSSTYTNPGTLTLTGLSRLEGRPVVGIADGIGFGPLTVTGGQITLPSTFPTTVVTVTVGLPIYYAGQPMRFDLDPRGGNTQALKKQISDVYIRVFNSMGGNICNGTSNYPVWVSGHLYVVNDNVVSPITTLAYQCIANTTGNVDPSASPAWVLTNPANYQAPVPIPYAPSQTVPTANAKFISKPKDIRITPMLQPFMDDDPIVIVSGSDALPLTVLGIVLKYEIISTP